MSVLKLTFVDGSVKEVPFTTASTVSVQTPTGPDGSVKSLTVSEIVSFEVADDPVEEAPVEEPAPAPVLELVPAPAVSEEPVEEVPAEDEPDDPTLATPEDAITHAIGLPIDDAHAHIVAALVKFPDDPDLLVAKTDIEAAQASAPPAA